MQLHTKDVLTSHVSIEKLKLEFITECTAENLFAEFSCQLTGC